MEPIFVPSRLGACQPLRNTQSHVGFVRGGVCHYGQCPAMSDDGCPLSRELKFNSSSGCESFARFTFCRTASPNRQRPPHAAFDGCHAGGGNAIAEITM